MFHSIRLLRAQLSASSFAEPGMQLLSDIALSAWRTPLARAQALQRASAAVCRMHGIEVRVTGTLTPDVAIYVSNHLGYVDPLVICSLVACAPIAKVEVAAWPGIGTLVRRLGAIFVQRDDTHSAARTLLSAMRRLDSGVSVLNFPEGTTTRGELLPFRRGIFGLAAQLGIPVVPIAISFDAPALCWVDDESLLLHYSTELMGKAHRVEAHFGPHLYAQPKESASQFAARVRRWIASALSASSRSEPPRLRLAPQLAALGTRGARRSGSHSSGALPAS